MKVRLNGTHCENSGTELQPSEWQPIYKLLQVKKGIDKLLKRERNVDNCLASEFSAGSFSYDIEEEYEVTGFFYLTKTCVILEVRDYSLLCENGKYGRWVGILDEYNRDGGNIREGNDYKFVMYRKDLERMYAEMNQPTLF